MSESFLSKRLVFFTVLKLDMFKKRVLNEHVLSEAIMIVIFLHSCSSFPYGSLRFSSKNLDSVIFLSAYTSSEHLF